MYTVLQSHCLLRACWRRPVVPQYGFGRKYSRKVCCDVILPNKIAAVGCGASLGGVCHYFVVSALHTDGTCSRSSSSSAMLALMCTCHALPRAPSTMSTALHCALSACRMCTMLHVHTERDGERSCMRASACACGYGEDRCGTLWFWPDRARDGGEGRRERLRACRSPIARRTSTFLRRDRCSLLGQARIRTHAPVSARRPDPEKGLACRTSSTRIGPTPRFPRWQRNLIGNQLPPASIQPPKIGQAAPALKGGQCCDSPPPQCSSTDSIRCRAARNGRRRRLQRGPFAPSP